jgi:hypothetical protein
MTRKGKIGIAILVVAVLALGLYRSGAIEKILNAIFARMY